MSVPIRISMIVVAVAYIALGIATASALFYAPILWALIRLKITGNTPPLLPEGLKPLIWQNP